jgi:ribosomal protein S18 acetylase RimI-like enzyme
MNKFDFLKKYILPFLKINYVFWPTKGFIVWRKGTGENIELLHIRTFDSNKGYAKQLVKEMIKRIQKNPPYYSIFGFGLTTPEKPHLKEIYKKLGFNVSGDIPGPYKGGSSFLFYQSYEELKQKYLKEI